MDFGIAKQHGGTGGATVTATGSLMGTPEYMSPEQLRGECVDFRGDLYSFGVVIFELFTGQLPFRGDTAVATIVRQLHDAPFLELPLLPPPLRPVLARALAKNATDRYPSAAEMRRALLAACARSAPGLAAGPAALGPRPEDETRPLVPASADRPPIGRMAVAQAALALLAVHLVSAGGAAAPPALSPPRSGTAVGAPTAGRPAPDEPTPAPIVEIRPVWSSTGAAGEALPLVSATPPPTPLPTSAAMAPSGPLRPAAETSALLFDSRVYAEDEVDVRPRRISGASAAYPEWGPKLDRGERVSITASFVVNEAGDVTDIRVEQGGGVLEAVLPEISRWKYEPGRRDGRPVKVRMSWKHTFIGG
jgi:hypothetical protein